MQYCFIHAADLHIDSPFVGLGAKDPAVAARFAQAGRRAVENLIQRTLDEKAAFLIIAGDVFDGDWNDFSTGLFFARALGRLDRAGIPTFIIKGNHDAESLVSKSLTYPPSVTTFAFAKAETVCLDQLGVALHGRSFGTRHVAADFAASYPPARRGMLNIGVLHTSLDGTRGHEAYAPCSAQDLARHGYDYWALGHIHAAAQVSTAHPRIVFPGNIQGRNIRETGVKGAMRVGVENGRIIEVTPLALDAARWALASVDLGGCQDEDELRRRLKAAIVDAHADAGGLPLALRLALRGTTPLHARIVAYNEALLADARAVAFAVADDCWIESLRPGSASLPRAAYGVPSGIEAGIASDLDLDGLLERTAGAEAFETEVDKLLRSIVDKLPGSVRQAMARAPDHGLDRIKALARDHLAGLLGREGAAAP